MTDKWKYSKGLHDLGNNVYAYLQPNGSWGWSNAGVIADGDVSLLVDTLYDLKLTQEMLDTLRRSIPATARIDMVVNTHADGDHCYGNQLVSDAQIIASVRTAEEMLEKPPAKFAALAGMTQWREQVGDFVNRFFDTFKFDDIIFTPPTRTFEGELTVHVGDKEVQLIEVGPAHTRGDTLIYVPDDKVVFTGDVLFIGGHPIAWEGAVKNWIRACDRILQMDVETIVPGHGPITDKQGVLQVKDYLTYVWQEAQARYEAGMSAFDAAREIDLSAYDGWTDRERIAVTVTSIYRELNGDQEPPNLLGLIGQMASLSEQK